MQHVLDLIVPPGDFRFVDLTLCEACTMLWMEESPYMPASLNMSAQPCRRRSGVQQHLSTILTWSVCFSVCVPGLKTQNCGLVARGSLIRQCRHGPACPVVLQKC